MDSGLGRADTIDFIVSYFFAEYTLSDYANVSLLGKAGSDYIVKFDIILSNGTVWWYGIFPSEGTVFTKEDGQWKIKGNGYYSWIYMFASSWKIVGADGAVEINPLVCPKRQGAMRIISNIEDPSVIRDILKHRGIWLVRSRPPPKTHDPPVCIQETVRPAAPYIMDDLCRQLPLNDDHFYSDPEYSCDEYIRAERIMKRGAQQRSA